VKIGLAFLLWTMLWQSTTPAGSFPPPSPSAVPPTNKKIVRNGGASDAEITFVPSITPEQASQETIAAKRSLETTEADLKIISQRGPNADRLEVIAEVKNYVTQAKVSLDGGDVERAYKLATKARILTDDLLKH
jgi:hypothetical protein